MEKQIMPDNSLSPHGGVLIERIIPPAQAQEQIQGLPRLPVSDQIARECIDLAYGFLSPLDGFMAYADVDAVVKKMRLVSGFIWSVPIVYDITENQIDSLGLHQGDSLVLTYQDQPLALLEIQEIFAYDPQLLAQHVYGTTDPQHPGVARTYSQKERFLGGPITLLNEPVINPPFNRFWYPPRHMRAVMAKNGWRTVVAHQTRNVPHTGHEWLMKSAWFASEADAILVSAVIGEKKIGDYIDEAIVLGHDTLRQAGYFKDNIHFTSIFLWDMRYAGPREAILHAIVRKNMGCSHHMFGRDHAGVGNYYDPYAAHEIFDQLPNLGITAVKTLAWHYCPRCGGAAYDGFCNHQKEKQELSGTRVREVIESGQQPTDQIFRPDVFDLVMDCGTRYSDGAPFVTEAYLQKRNPIFSLAPLP